MIYCVYAKSTGVIRARFDTSDSLAEQQIQSDDEAIYPGDADPRCHIIERGERVDLRTRDPGGGAIWDEHEMRWLGLKEQHARSARFAKFKIAELEKRQARIDRELRLRPNEVGSDGKTPQQRLEELDAEMGRLRAIISGEKETIAREG